MNYTWFALVPIPVFSSSNHYDAFVKRLANAKFLVLKVRGHAGLDQINPKIHPKNIAIVPVSLAGDNTGLLKLIENCSNSLDSSK